MREDLTIKHRRAILAAVKAAPPTGISTTDLGRALNLCRTTTGNALRELAEAGQVEKSGIKGPHCKWGVPGISAYYLEHAARRRRQRAYKAAMLIGESTAGVWADTLPTHSLVPAHAAPPLRPAGPRDVWSLGAA